MRFFNLLYFCSISLIVGFWGEVVEELKKKGRGGKVVEVTGLELLWGNF